MTPEDVLLDAFNRIRSLVPTVVDGLDVEQLTTRLDDRANSIAWLVWHLSRVQDSHVADAGGFGEVWEDDGWRERFGLELPPDDTGYGHSADDAGKVRTTAELLTGYHAAVAARTERFVSGLAPHDLDRVVDESWSLPVTLGVRLVSVVADCLQHVGQAAFVRGCLGA